MDIVFNCPHCNLEIEVDQEAAGQEFDCPTCQKTLTVPEAPARSGRGLAASAAAANPPPPVSTRRRSPRRARQPARRSAWRCR